MLWKTLNAEIVKQDYCEELREASIKQRANNEAKKEKKKISGQGIEGERVATKIVSRIFGRRHEKLSV